MARSIMVMAGGTGGHIFPALAVAKRLQQDGWQVTWLGAPVSMEAELVPKHGIEMALVRFSGLRGKGLLRKFMLPFNLLIALWQSAGAIFRYRPDVVLGMGGYITFPGGLMAALLRRPLVIHEQNSIAGLSNKVLAHLSSKVMSGFPDVLPGAQWCGNPVRNEISVLDTPELRFQDRTGRLQILVVGGSLGAAAINEAVPAALALMPAEIRPKVLHQTGKKHYEATCELYRKADVAADIRPFIDDMAACYAAADLVICRSGALTVAELASAGAASLLIPFPHAVDDHQTHNASFLSSQGAAILLPQTELNAQKLVEILGGLTREKLLEMATLARRQAKNAAVEEVATVCKELAG